MSRRDVLGAALGLGLALAPWRLQAREDASAPPAAPGELLSVDERAARVLPLDLDWVDGARQRPVPARLYWPSTPQPRATVPLVVFSHGIGGSRVGYSYLGRHLAALGWACLHVQHTGSDRSLWLGNPLTLVSRLQHAAREEEAVHRVLDLRFALDRLLAPPDGASPLAGMAERVDRDRLVVAGHSYGANTTLLSVGARVERPGVRHELADARWRAGIVLSAPPFYGERDLSAILAPVRVPTLHVTSNEDVIQIPGYHSGVEDRIAVFEAVADPRKALAVFQRGGHSVFTDRQVSGGAEMNRQVKTATKTLAAAFLQQQFAAQPDALSGWARQWQAELARTAGLLSPLPAPLQSPA
ncbi:alpha/beta hydrolase family protein [Ideonella sp.]|uniref:alpha/beta hydrolase family protein n=1 Tax=Ideonella sp. TaxID=1929293 RepID=UPI0035AE2186